MASDIEYWSQDDVRRNRLDGVIAKYNLTDSDAFVPGGVAEWMARAEEGSETEHEGKTALVRLLHLMLNLMRLESDLPYTAETDPNKWPTNELTQVVVGKRRKQVRVSGEGQGVKGGDRKVWKETPDDIRGWGSDRLVNTNPLNYDGVRGTNDAMPGWWYRMVWDEANRETVLRTLRFFDPSECEKVERAATLMNPDQNPRRKQALAIAEYCKDIQYDKPTRKGGRRAAATT